MNPGYCSSADSKLLIGRLPPLSCSPFPLDRNGTPPVFWDVTSDYPRRHSLLTAAVTTNYFTRSDYPGQFFECPRLRGSVSTDWCARQWREVNTQPDGRRHPRWVSCSGCATGAEHAGVRVQDMPPALAEMRICARCELESSRIIRGYLCVSCYNREREYRIGRNAKGKPPIKHPPLTDIRLRVFDPARPKADPVRVVLGCCSYREAVNRVFQQARPGVMVSKCPPVQILAQGGMC